jgi:hypothetical protein
MPNSAKFVDMGKLPATDTIARHLLPITFAERQTPDGILMESSGTITYPQAIVAIAGGAGFTLAARSKLEQQSAALEGATQRPPQRKPLPVPPARPPATPAPPPAPPIGN